MTEKTAVTVLLTEIQAGKLKTESNKTGNSQNSIVRTALEQYFDLKTGNRVD